MLKKDNFVKYTNIMDKKNQTQKVKKHLVHCFYFELAIQT